MVSLDNLYLCGHVVLITCFSVFMFGQNCSTVSAPGKILVAGGYLVLERPNIGITLGASSRFFVSVCEQVSNAMNFVLLGVGVDILCAIFPEIGVLQDHDRVRENLLISVESPQFHTSYSYSYDHLQNNLTMLRFVQLYGILYQIYRNLIQLCVGSGKGNEFVEKCLALTLSFARRSLKDAQVPFEAIIKAMASNKKKVRIVVD